MKIKVSKKNLDDSRKLVAASLASSGDSIESHIIFRKRGDQVELLSYYGRLCGSAPLECECEGEDGSFTIEGSRLDKWLKVVSEATLTLVYENRKTKATSSRGSVVFQSRDVSSFPFWDAEYANAKPTAKVAADKLASILDYVKFFTWDQDTKGPQFCVTEARDGVFWASDQSSLVYVESEEFRECSLRVFREDVPACVKYLKLMKDEEVEILETPGSIYFKRLDGGVFGFTRYNTAFPKMSGFGPDMPDHVWWSFDKTEVLTVIGLLAAAAENNDVRLQIVPHPDESRFDIKMRSASGDVMSLDVPLHNYGQADSWEGSFDEKGFTVNYLFIQKALAEYTEDVVRMGISVRPKGRGWVRFDETRYGAYYLTVLTWMAV